MYKPDEAQRLSKVMATRGICSRREADDYISRGLVLVNGIRATLGQKIMPDDKIELSDVARNAQDARVTVLINKPLGYVSGQAEDGYKPAKVLVTPGNRWIGDTTGLRFSPFHLSNLVPAGRLDINSTGLLVLTQDGRVARKLIGENSSVEKEYLVRVSGHIFENGLKLLNYGLSLDGEALLPAKVSWLENGLLRFTLHQGKKRQIRRMCELVGLNVVSLRRVRIGRIRLGALPSGKWRYLKSSEYF